MEDFFVSTNFNGDFPGLCEFGRRKTVVSGDVSWELSGASGGRQPQCGGQWPLGHCNSARAPNLLAPAGLGEPYGTMMNHASCQAKVDEEEEEEDDDDEPGKTGGLPPL